ncbi:MAG: Uma2 family endonuclease [Blastocatellia bacterium]
MTKKNTPRRNGKTASQSKKAKQTGLALRHVVYPESDGLPMAENTKQYQWITRITDGLDARFDSDPKVFVAGDLFWYPVEGDRKLCTAPDTMVVFGRHKGHRGSYKEWEEGGIAPQVVFEIWSPSNTKEEKELKLAFYERYGVEEYYAFDPDKEVMEGWRRRGRKLEPIADMREWKSPLLNVKFRSINGVWNLYHPDGEPFVNFKEVVTQRESERKAKEAAWAKLRELGIDPETL